MKNSKPNKATKIVIHYKDGKTDSYECDETIVIVKEEEGTAIQTACSLGFAERAYEHLEQVLVHFHKQVLIKRTKLELLGDNPLSRMFKEFAGEDGVMAMVEEIEKDLEDVESLEDLERLITKNKLGKVKENLKSKKKIKSRESQDVGKIIDFLKSRGESNLKN